MIQFIRLSIKEISLRKIQTGTYILLLEEENYRKMKIPIIIDSFQAKSIISVLEKKDQMRSFPHDLFFTFSKKFHIQLQSVVIYKLINGIFFSYLLFEKKENNNKNKHKIHSKTSDAVALAIRFQAPIFVTKEIFEKTGIYLKKNSFFEEEKKKKEDNNKIIFSYNQIKNKKLKNMTEKDLNLLLNQAIKKECYELAAKIKKELDKRE